jgi:hypothetical protein
VVHLSVPVLAALHGSGAVEVYAPSADGSHRQAGEMRLPVPLAVAQSGHFLLAADASAGVLLVVLTVDCEPRPHALHVYSLALTMRITRRVSFASTLVAHRDGPFDRLAGALILPTGARGGLAEDASAPVLVLATETGHLAAMEMAPTGTPGSSGVGLPSRTIWTAEDDVASAFGCWHAFDSLRTNVTERLLAARRFSTAAVAKALRAPELANADRLDLAHLAESHVAEAVNVGEDEAQVGDRLVQSAQRHALLLDMPVSRVEYVPGVGAVISRNSGIFAIRPMFEEESICARESDAVREALSGFGEESRLQTSTGDDFVARTLAAHATPQLAAARLFITPPDSSERAVAACVLSLSFRVAESGDGNQSVGEVSKHYYEATDEPRESNWKRWVGAVCDATAALVPGKQALLFLHSAVEYAALQDLADRCSELLPISCLFCQGLVLLELSKRRHNASASVMVVDGGAENSTSTDAFSSFVSAAKYAGNNAARSVRPDLLEREDIDCVIELAQLHLRLSGGVRPTDDDENMSEDKPENGAPSASETRYLALRKHLDFWLLERSLRLIEGGDFAEAAAAMALEALSVAPDAKKYEMMRAAAFGRFLDAGDLEYALQTILKPPFQVSGLQVGEAVNEECACALRDCVGLLVNAAIDRGRFAWLLEGELPAPVKELAALALERRARSSEMFVREHLIQEIRHGAILGGDSATRVSSPYEYLYVWQLERQDVNGAAVCALEWYERIASEGLNETRVFAASSRASLVQSPLALLLTWARIKSRALAAACATVRSLPGGQQYVARSRHCILAGYTPVSVAEGVVDLDWLSRRHLLARAQMTCLSKRIGKESQTETALTPSKMPSSDYVLSQADVLLGDGDRGVSFAVSSLLASPTSIEATFQALDLALAWRSEDCGDSLVAGVISVAGMRASARLPGNSTSVHVLSYADLNRLLDHVTTATETGGRCMSRNWYRVAAEGALEASAGTTGLPRWLSDAASFGPGVGAEARAFASGKLGGDACGMIQLWLRYGRLAEAAELLICGLHESIALLQRHDLTAAQVDIPYSCLDSTLELLAESIRTESGGPVEKQYHEELRSLACTLAELPAT